MLIDAYRLSKLIYFTTKCTGPETPLNYTVINHHPPYIWLEQPDFDLYHRKVFLANLFFISLISCYNLFFSSHRLNQHHLCWIQTQMAVPQLRHVDNVLRSPIIKLNRWKKPSNYPSSSILSLAKNWELGSAYANPE